MTPTAADVAGALNHLADTIEAAWRDEPRGGLPIVHEQHLNGRIHARASLALLRAALDAKDAEIGRLMALLKTGSCVYCDFEQVYETAEIRREAMIAHVAECAERPERLLLDRLIDAVAEIARLRAVEAAAEHMRGALRPVYDYAEMEPGLRKIVFAAMTEYDRALATPAPEGKP